MIAIHGETRVIWRALIFGQFSTMVVVPCQASRAGVFKRMLLGALEPARRNFTDAPTAHHAP
jgi:hypothetical protein